MTSEDEARLAVALLTPDELSDLAAELGLLADRNVPHPRSPGRGHEEDGGTGELAPSGGTVLAGVPDEDIDALLVELLEARSEVDDGAGSASTSGVAVGPLSTGGAELGTLDDVDVEAMLAVMVEVGGAAAIPVASDRDRSDRAAGLPGTSVGGSLRDVAHAVADLQLASTGEGDAAQAWLAFTAVLADRSSVLTSADLGPADVEELGKLLLVAGVLGDPGGPVRARS